ncbi:MAG: putative rhomboid family rane protein [Actinomycetota bacterium]
MTSPASACYRHPSRESWVLCQRCGNTICGDCQRPAAVGFHCPDCVKAAAPATAKIVTGAKLRRAVQGRTPVTVALLGIMAVVFVAQFVTQDLVTAYLGYIPALTWEEPWRLITVAFVHGSITHILFNGYSLWVLGNLLERVLGPVRFLTVFFVSSIAGSFAVLAFGSSSFVVGASGGIFGLFAALFVVNRGFGGNNISLVVIIGINLALGFILPGIAWEAHVGGLVAGLATTALLQRFRS